MTRSEQPEGNGGSTLVGIREYFSLWLHRLEDLLVERDRRYEARFTAIESNTDERFRYADKAAAKAAEAQTHHNDLTNNYQRRLDDQARDMASRHDVDILVNVLREKIESVEKELGRLREAGSIDIGGKAAATDFRAVLFGVGMMLLGSAGVVSSIIIAIVNHR